MTMRLRDRVTVVTGGASGIGEGIAARFAEEGAKVVVADVDAARGRSVAASVGGVFVDCDVTRETDVAGSVATALDRYGRLDCYVANAGFSFSDGPIIELDEEGFDRTVAVLLKGVAFGLKHAARAMRDRAGGSIICTSSISAMSAGMGPHVYSACKAAVNSLTRTVAFEEGAYGTRVNCLCPGSIATSLPARLLGLEHDDDRARLLDEALSEAWAPDIALRRRGTPSDVAGAAAWLASDDAAYVTGQAIVVDGGLALGKALADVTSSRSD